MTVSRNRPSLVGAALLWLAGDAAWAQHEAAIAVTWRGATCAEVDGLGPRIEAALPGRRAPGSLEVAADATADGWRATLTLDGAAALVRTIHANDCRSLVDAAELVAVVALDPFVLADEVAAVVAIGREPVDVIEDDAPPSSTPPPARRPSPRDDRGTASARLELGIGGIDLPGEGGRVGLALGWQRRRVRVEVPLRWSWPRVHEIDDAIDVRLQLVSALPRVCAVLGARALQVLGCAGIELGAMLAAGRGDGLVAARRRAAPWVAPHAGIAMSWRLVPRVSGWLGVDGAVAIGRPAFHVREPADAYQAGPASISLVLGLAVHFGSSFRTARRTESSDR